MKIPNEVSRRKVTKRGAHLLPFGYHGYDAEAWAKRFVGMGLSWVVACVEDEGFRPYAETYLQHGIIPIVRPSYHLPRPWTFFDETEALKAIYDRYGAPLIVQFANEPFDPREWVNQEVPPEDEAWAFIAQRWREMADLTVARGAYPGFPDGPCYDRNPFFEILDEARYWKDGKAVYLGHFYVKNRPLDYPEDDVTKYGTPIDYDTYVAELDVMASNPYWNEGPPYVERMNAQREAWANPNLTPVDDPTCFRGWEQIVYYSRQAFGFDVQIALTEGGSCPKDMAGSNPTDIRWTPTTPWMVAKKTVKMLEADTPLFAICPWLVADSDMGGAGGWENDAWIGWGFEPEYGREKPIVKVLESIPAGGRTVDIIVEDRFGNPQPWSWVIENYGPIIITDFEGPGYKVVKLKENADVGIYNYATTKRGRKTNIVNREEILKADWLNPDLAGAIDAASVIIVKVLDMNGYPLEGVAVPWYWPDALVRDTCLPPNGLPPEIPVLRFDGPGITNAAGDIGFAMGAGAYYFPPAIGPHAVWVCDPGKATQFVIGLGMLGGTNHFSLWPTFQYIDEPEPPDPGDCRYDEILTLGQGIEADVKASRWRGKLALDKLAELYAILEGS